NGADSWSKIDDENKILDDLSTIFAIAIEKENPNIVYVATLNRDRGELLRSEDGGKTWVSSYISTESGKPINHVQIDPIHSNIVYIGTEQGGLIRSDNRGNTWYTLEWFYTGVKDFVVDFQNNNSIIVRTFSYIKKTIDGGETWEDLNGKMMRSLTLKIGISLISSMTIDNQNPLVVYITYQNLILVTKDGGDTWEKMNTITPALTVLGTAPQVKQIGMIDNIIYYGAGNALYRSQDKGVSWSSHDIPIKGDVRYTVSDHSDSDIIYLGAFYDKPPKK
ncbi:MAG: YCF48-related protein, partial [Patescibacteria group bacterium]|nr:YCF48-related protein [Patescibacteria group bacterium]